MRSSQSGTQTLSVREDNMEVNAGCIYVNDKYQLAVTVKHLGEGVVSSPVETTHRDVILVLDYSSSMEGAKLEAIKTCLFYLLHQTPLATRMGVVAYASQAKVVVPLGSVYQDDAMAAVRELKAGGERDLHGAILLALDMLMHRGLEADRPASIIVLTGGSANLYQGHYWKGSAKYLAQTTKQFIEQRATALRGALNVDILTIGDEIDKHFLRAMQPLAVLPFERIDLDDIKGLKEKKRMGKLRKKIYEALAVATKVSMMEDALPSIEVVGGSKSVHVKRVDEKEPNETNPYLNADWGSHASYTHVPICSGSQIIRLFDIEFTESELDLDKPLATVEVHTSRGNKITIDVPHFAHNRQNPEVLSGAADYHITTLVAKALGNAAAKILGADTVSVEAKELRHKLRKAKEEVAAKQSMWCSEMTLEQSNQLANQVEYLKKKLDEATEILVHEDTDKRVLFADLFALQSSVLHMPRQDWSSKIASPVKDSRTQAKTWFDGFADKIDDKWKKVKDVSTGDLEFLTADPDKMIDEFKKQFKLDDSKTAWKKDKKMLMNDDYGLPKAI